MTTPPRLPSLANLLLAASLTTAAMADNTVRIDSGLVEPAGGGSPAVRAYLGIPFAAPPVGDLRWREPQPAAPWAGVRVADRFGPVCQQPLIPRNAIMRLFSFADPPECGMSED